MIKQRIGILGGGQLGRMLFLEGSPRGFQISMMDQSASFPGGQVCPNFMEGDFTVFEDVVRFGTTVDTITIEIEKINTEALKELEQSGKTVFPQPTVIEMIQDKGLQKKFYQNNGFATAPGIECKDLTELTSKVKNGTIVLPVVQKMRRGGYDGRGVHVIHTASDLDQAFEKDFILEEAIDIEKEISVITCRNPQGQIVMYDAVEMIFNEENNILSHQLAPATIQEEIDQEARQLALAITQKLQIVGLLAIEMFLTKDGRILVNEMAPRPHNSGHHTIEACWTSQYENHLRAITSSPMGHVDLHHKSILLNLLGEPGYEGPAKYQGLEEAFESPGVFVHIYGKEITKPFRKMGHVNILADSHDKLDVLFRLVQNNLKVISGN